MTPTETAERVREDVERLRRKAAQAIEDGMDAAGRSLRKTRYGLMDARDEAVHCVKRRPVAAVVVAFGAGAIVGIVLGILGRQRSA
jgi:ElaB/YqjD/DUF883 family membrane-anchored ribosome-binding protein